MSNINHRMMKSNTCIDVNFEGGELSSDSGLLLVKEFIHKLGFDALIKKHFHTRGEGFFRIHTDYGNFMQMLFQIIAGYFTDDCADNLTVDPVFTACLDKPALASQPTISRFFKRMDECSLTQMEQIQKMMRSIVYSLPGQRPNIMVFDLDTTLLNTYGNQEGKAWNYHYGADGYHPKVCFDGITGDLLRIELRNGTEYCSNNVVEFMKPLFEEFTQKYKFTNLFLRGDSGFAAPELYKQCEDHGCQYAIRLKQNSVLTNKAAGLAKELDVITKDDKVSYACVLGEFQYAANSWDKERRVICKIETPQNSIMYQSTFIVTTIHDPPEWVVKYYCKRGTMENYIKEGKNGFDFSAVSSSSMIVNSNRLQLHAIAYNIINWMRRLVFPDTMQDATIDTIRLRLIKIASRIIRHAHKLVFKLCSSCPYKYEFFKIMDNISKLNPFQSLKNLEPAS